MFILFILNILTVYIGAYTHSLLLLGYTIQLYKTNNNDIKAEWTQTSNPGLVCSQSLATHHLWMLTKDVG